MKYDVPIWCENVKLPDLECSRTRVVVVSRFVTAEDVKHSDAVLFSLHLHPPHSRQEKETLVVEQGMVSDEGQKGSVKFAVVLLKNLKTTPRFLTCSSFDAGD